MRIEYDRLVKRYGKTVAVDIAQLAIEPHQRVGLVGNNGAGKTTLLRLTLDIAEANEGTVRIDGQPVAGHIDWKRQTGSFLDDSFLIDFLTPEEYFRFIADAYGLSKVDIDVRLQAFEQFFAGEVLGRKKYIRDLSQGNRKKVGIAAAMMVTPQLLLLDEPFANLDPSSQIRLKRILLELHEQSGATMLISSHDLSHVTEVCDRIVVLERGRIVRDIHTSSETLEELEGYFMGQDQHNSL